MFNSIREELESTVAPLMREIFEDARKLMRQEAQLVRAEVKEESRRIQGAFVYVALGGAALFVSVFLCSFMLAYLVAVQWFDVPLWLAFGLVAVVMAALGVALSYRGLKMMRAVTRSSGQTIEALREGFSWMQ